MKLLVTGGSGFLGTEVVRQLADAGHQPVVFDLRPRPEALERALANRARRVPVIQGDVSDFDQVIGVAREHGVDGMVHLASLLADRSTANPALAVKVNCQGTANVFEAARLLALARVVWASSASVTDGHARDVRLDEDTLPKPSNLYGACKVLNEHVAQVYKRVHGLDTIGLRFCFLNGPRIEPGVPTTLVAELVAKPVLGLPGRVLYADDVPDWLWIEDAARAVVLALRVGSHSRLVYNMSGDPRGIREVAAFIKSKIPSAGFTYEPGIRTFYHNTDASEIRRELGFEPRWTMEAQFEKFIEMLRSDRDLATSIASMGAP